MIFNLEEKSFVLFDGAMGTMLQRYGLGVGERPEVFNITHPDVVARIHKEYIDAGSDVITTNTFGANEVRLSGSGYTVEKIVSEAVKIARSSANGRKVALDVGPTGEFVEPFGDLTYEQAYDIFSRQITSGVDAGADLILIETFSDINEAKAAIESAKSKTSVPVICTFTFQKEGRTFMGYDVKSVVSFLQNMGVDALGINCSMGPKDMLVILEELLAYTSLPVIVQPNAGLPEFKNGKLIYNVSPQEFGGYVKTMKKMGVKIFGGCCGTDPEFIKEVKKVLEENMKE